MKIGGKEMAGGRKIVATIADTLREIPDLQIEFDAELASGAPLDKQFVEDLTNLTSVYYFDLVAHGAMDRLRGTSANSSDPFVQKYNQIISQKDCLSQYIRWQNIGLLYSIWGVFEQFIIRLHGQVSSKNPNEIESKHKTLLRAKRFKKVDENRILEKFRGIRRTRNSLHSGGIYQQGTNTYSFEVGDTLYKLEPGEPVQPIRLIDVIRTMWEHYLELKEKG